MDPRLEAVIGSYVEQIGARVEQQAEQIEQLSGQVRVGFSIISFENDLLAGVNYIVALETDEGQEELRAMRLAFVRELLQKMLAASRESRVRTVPGRAAPAGQDAEAS